jgi:hypothetical protein
MTGGLKSKAAYTDEDVARVWANIEGHVTPAQAEHAVAAAAAETIQTLGGRRGKAVYGWSGGKDSQALRVVMDAAGVQRAVLGIIPALEWRCYLEWIAARAPAGLTVYENSIIDLGWLAANRKHLFPADSKGGYWWALQSARYAQHRYQAEHDPPVQVLGRRTADANHIPPGGIAELGRGVTVYCPIRDWSHEMVLAVVKYYSGLPPIYDRPFGWTAGTGTWAGRRKHHGGSWAGVRAVEPARADEAARYFPAAARS